MSLAVATLPAGNLTGFFSSEESASRATLMALPLLLAVVGLIASVLGIYSMRVFKKINPQSALRGATVLTTLIFLLAALILVLVPGVAAGVFWSVLAGSIGGILIGLISYCLLLGHFPEGGFTQFSLHTHWFSVKWTFRGLAIVHKDQANPALTR